LPHLLERHRWTNQSSLIRANDAAPPIAACSRQREQYPFRITAEGGSFFEKLPHGADIYLMIRVLHDWPDEDALRILRSCRRAVRDEARLLIGEAIVEPDPLRGHPSEYLIDLQMLAMFGTARARTEAEFRTLLASTGFDLRRTIPTNSSVSILEAAPLK